MEPIRVTATELRTRARELIERVHYYRECYQVETFGRPMAVIISCEDFQQLQALLPEPLHSPLPLTNRGAVLAPRKQRRAPRKPLLQKKP